MSEGSQPAELSVQLPRTKHAATLARDIVRARFEGELADRQLSDLLIIVSELATNAFLHGVGEIRLRLRSADGRVYGEVVDGGEGFVGEVRELGIDEVGRRGLLVVARLSERWGIHEGSSHVWFELAPGADGPAAEPELGADERPPEIPGPA